jgi:2-aminoethylphosphonate-pyruvate transaminase
MQHLLLNPGPVNISERVRKAMLRPDLCHRESEFTELQDNIRNNLLKIYNLPQTEWAAILLTGSGTAAVEAMLTSMVPDNGHVLIIENGVYGERMTRMAETCHIPHTTLHFEWGANIPLQELDRVLKQEQISHVAVIHHETTTGRLNNIAAIAEVCGARNISLLLDGVSSFGAETLNFNEWNIAACAATANKCLHAVPGTAFVIVNRKQIEKTDLTPRNVYLDLKTYLHQQDSGGTPFTQSVQCFYALEEALRELQDQGGWQYRQKQYQQHMKIIRDGMIALGVVPLLDVTESSCVLNAYHLPKKISYQTLHDKLKESGFVIYAGQGNLSRILFRVSAMGAITEDDMHRLVKEIRKIILPGS